MESRKKRQSGKVFANSTQKHKIQKNSCKQVQDSYLSSTFWCESGSEYSGNVLE